MIVKMMLEMPSSFLVEENGHPIQDIVSITYPILLDLFGNVECFKDKMILAPPLEVINSVNKVNEGIGVQADWLTTKFLNDIKCFGLHDH
ncbi:hypothetical protein GmHk_09G025317 [Glycine max]|nr:hypothetical protein GmHk_09G025317 [Glycine max]